jgi:hypothetical protein
MLRALLSVLTLAAALSAQSLADRKALTEKEPQNGTAWFQLGDALLAANQPVESVPAFQKARQLGFQPPVAAERIVRAWVLAKNSEEALKMLERMAQGGFAAAALVENDAALSPLRSDARYTTALTQIRGNAAPCETREQHKQLDFWLGDWAVYDNAGKLAGVNKIEKLLNGCLIVENWTGAAGMTGKSMNFYDSSLQKWRQVWVDASGNPVFVAGGLQPDGSMRLSGTGKNPQGEFQRRMTVSKLDDGGLRQHWEQSKDGGATWVTVFDGRYKKRTTEALAAKQFPACTAPQFRKFDFWLGEWDVQSPGGISANPPRSSIQKIVNGCVIFENWMPPGGGDGKSFNFYSPDDKKWHQIWIATGAGVLDMTGDFEGKALHYEGVVQGNGRKALQKLTFTPLDDGRVHQYWEQSTDDGKTWTVAFDGYYNRRK